MPVERKLELGTIHPQEPGWETLDLRPGATHVQSAISLSNFEDNTFSRICTTDMIEHLSWRDVPAALSEWLRVLEPGGELHVDTPNAWELAAILRGESTGSRVGNESKWEQFSRVGFGHQDYPENTHKSYFTPEWLEELLYEAGAKEVWTIYTALTRFQLGASK